MRRRLVVGLCGVALVVVAVGSAAFASGLFDGARPSATPSQRPSNVSGRLCFWAAALTTCAGMPVNIAFHPGHTIYLYLERPFYADGWVHLEVFRVRPDPSAGDAVPFRKSDFQFIPNNFGVMSDLGAADAFVARQGGPTGAVYRADAYVDGLLTASATFTVYPDASPS